MIPNMACVRLHALLLHVWIFGLQCIEVGSQWHFGVDHHHALVRQAN